MPTTRRSRVLGATPESIWAVAADPHHLPRWWPRVTRVENVEADAWTTVMLSKRGRPVRADFRLDESVAPNRRRWVQELDDTAFEGLMTESSTELRIEPADGSSRVTLEVRQRLRGMARFGGLLFRRANRRALDEALARLEEISV